MCSFCNKIVTDKEYDKMNYMERMDLPFAFIMKDIARSVYHLYLLCDDDFYSGKYLENIEYCPKCGRELND